jgi:hypothetical protein
MKNQPKHAKKRDTRGVRAARRMIRTGVGGGWHNGVSWLYLTGRTGDKNDRGRAAKP